MLLRESDVARRVRDYLLDAETVSGPQLAIPQSYAEALRAAADQWERAEAAEHALKQAEAWARELEPAAAVTVFLADADGDDFSFADAAKILCRHPLVNTGERRLFDQLNEWKWIYRASGRRHWCAYQSQVNAGRLVERIGQPYEHRTRGLVMPNPQVRITIKGIQDILHKLTGERDLAVGMVSA
jgi:DNA-damage-inducible protein D